MKIKAVVFDMDGVLIDSHEFITKAIEHTLAAKGLTATPEQIAAVTGQPIYAMYKAFAPEYDPYELQAAHIRHHDENLHLLRDYKGTHEALQALRDQGYKVGLFTGADGPMVYDRLGWFGLTDYFDSIFDTTRYTKHKPDPEGLLLCLDELGIGPANALYIGDGIGDMLAGKKAGVHTTVGITHGFGKAEDLVAAGADHIIDSLAELAAIIKKVEQ